MSTEDNKVKKSLHLQVNENGSMGMEFDGDFNLHEITGMLLVSLADIFTKHFTVPYLNEQSLKIVEHLSAELNPISEKTDLDKELKGINELNGSVKEILNLVDAFKNMKEPVKTTELS